MLQENANPKHLKFMSHVPEAQETEFENAQLRKWGASDTPQKVFLVQLLGLQACLARSFTALGEPNHILGTLVLL